MNGDQAEKKLLCIVCPEGCEIDVTDAAGELVFSPNACKRGREYARQEITDPRRTLTTTVRLLRGPVAMLPVRTRSAIPKGLLERAMNQIAEIQVEAPVSVGQVVCTDLAGTGIPLVASRTVERVEAS
jgi:CxxC motif-containing protein